MRQRTSLLACILWNAYSHQRSPPPADLATAGRILDEVFGDGQETSPRQADKLRSLLPAFGNTLLALGLTNQGTGFSWAFARYYSTSGEETNEDRRAAISSAARWMRALSGCPCSGRDRV